MGVEIRGTEWDRENDVLSFVVSQALNDQLFILSDIQIIDNPGGDTDNDTTVVLGTRAYVNFCEQRPYYCQEEDA